MSAKVSLLGWKVSGLRCPDHEINLCRKDSDNPYQVTLVQMPNGTGKTTTLNLLRSVLSGSAEHWKKSDVWAMKRSKDSVSKGEFSIDFLVDTVRVTFKLKLNFETGEAKFLTTKGSGEKPGFHPPREISRFLNPQFVDLFVFDGELATNLTDSRKTRAREAIDSLFQLSIFDELQDVFEKNWESHVEQVKNKGERVLAKRRNRLKKLEDQHSKLRLERNRLERDLSNTNEVLQQKNDSYNAAFRKDKDIGNKLKEVEKELIEANSNLEAVVKETIQEMRHPQSLSINFSNSLQELKSNLDTLKLPSSTSREFFEELASADKCVCGRTMDDHIRQIVKQRASLYLADEEVGVLNNIKGDIGKFCSENPDSYFSTFEGSIYKLNLKLKERDDLVTKERSLIEQRLSSGDAELEEKKAALDEIKEKYSTIKRRLEDLNSEPEGEEDDDTECIKALDKLIKEAKDQVAEATSTVELKNKTDIVKRILEDSKIYAREALRGLIVRETNERIKSLLLRDPILISNIQDSLLLEGQGGASVGQTLSVGYAFLATLFNRSDYSLPFVVDSPAGPLDLQVRPQVAKLIPKLCNQFVAFTISSERNKFVEPLAIAANNNVKYITVYRTEGQFEGIEVKHNIHRTRNGVVITGKEFFEKFDLDEEVEN